MTSKFIEYCNVSNEMLLELGEFTILWAQFELKYFNNDCTVNKLCELHKRVSLSNNLKNSCKNLINNLLEYFQTTKDLITENYIREKLYSTKNNYVNNEVIEVLTKDPSNESLITGVLLIIYRLRNNMFHGLKDCYTINRQFKLFQSVNDFLNEMV